jgi:hypothetical protein
VSKKHLNHHRPDAELSGVHPTKISGWMLNVAWLYTNFDPSAFAPRPRAAAMNRPMSTQTNAPPTFTSIFMSFAGVSNCVCDNGA